MHITDEEAIERLRAVDAYRQTAIAFLEAGDRDDAAEPIRAMRNRCQTLHDDLRDSRRGRFPRCAFGTAR